VIFSILFDLCQAVIEILLFCVTITRSADLLEYSVVVGCSSLGHDQMMMTSLVDTCREERKAATLCCGG